MSKLFTEPHFLIAAAIFIFAMIVHHATNSGKRKVHILTKQMNQN